MSYLLDALKQSQQASTSPAMGQGGDPAIHYQQQAELARYKRLVYLLGGSLLTVATLGVGFVAGKWVQGMESQPIAQSSAATATPVSAGEQSHPQAIQTTPQSGSGQPVTQMQANPVAAQYVPVQNTAAMQPVQWVPVQPVYQVMVPGGTPINLQSAAQSAQPDLSQYRVLGKPLAQSGQTNEPQTTQSNADEKVLAGVSPELQSAFAEAVAATEHSDPYEITQGTSTSAEVRPLELLPDRVRNQVPAFQYQAHIYATEADRRWIKLNDYELYEGDRFEGMLLEEIAPDQIVLNLHGTRFSVRAMEDWGQ